NELVVGPRCRRKADLDLLEAHPDERVPEPQLAVGIHRIDERLIAIAQVDRAPERRVLDPSVRPRAVRQPGVERPERPVFSERHRAQAHIHIGRSASGWRYASTQIVMSWMSQ